ncbi:MAG: nuclease [Methylocystis sp.]|nr:MAG: nuclease [Methylocystis sp.]
MALATLFFAAPAQALTPAPEAGACSLENATPATVAGIDDDFDLLLDDGRRAALSGLEFPNAPEQRAAARKRLSDWLAGRDVFIGALGAAPDRWGRTPARIFATQGSAADAPLVSVAAALLEEGRARFRPDPPAAGCAASYLAAEAPAREGHLGQWSDEAMRPVDAGAPDAAARLVHRKGMAIVFGVISSTGESRAALYLNFGEKRAENFSVVILRRNLAIFEQAGIVPRSLIGRQARVRGLIETSFGPRMQIASPAEIEIFDR